MDRIDFPAPATSNRHAAMPKPRIESLFHRNTQSLRHRARQGLQVACFSVLAISAAGCAKQWEDDQSYWVGADSLILSPPQPAPATNDAKKEYLGTIVQESQTDCDRFMQRLSVAETSDDTGLDIATTGLTALGAMFTPVGTAHILSGAASITSGTKTAIDSDFYAKATIGSYMQAIQASYYTDMKAYATALEATQDDLTLSIELSAIQRIHAECSLASAQNTIAATLKSSTAQTAEKSTKTLTITGPLQTDETLTITAASSALAKPEPVMFKTATTSAADAAKGLTDAINADSALQKLGVVATNPAAPNDNNIVLTWPSSTTLTWSMPAPTAQTTKKTNHKLWLFSVPMSPAIRAGATTVTPASADHSGSVPGHALQ